MLFLSEGLSIYAIENMGISVRISGLTWWASSNGSDLASKFNREVVADFNCPLNCMEPE